MMLKKSTRRQCGGELKKYLPVNLKNKGNKK